MELARLQLACDRPAAALLQVERALACRRGNPFAEGLRLAAELCERLQRPGEAAEHYRQLGQVAPNDPAATARAEEIAARPPAPRTSPPGDAPLPPELGLLDDAAIDTPGRVRVVGVVDRFFHDKGFGFLTYDGGQSIFFHVTQCEDGGVGITPGTRMSFLVGHNPKKGKPQAEALRRVDTGQ
jgi:cold shock CspA family protein